MGKKKLKKTAKPLSNGEVEILSVAWKAEHVTTAEVWDELKKIGPIDRTTVATRIRTMVDKRLLAVVEVGPPRKYAALVKQNAAIELSLRDLVRRFFGGSHRGLLNAFIAGNRTITPQEKKRLADELAKFDE